MASSYTTRLVKIFLCLTILAASSLACGEPAEETGLDTGSSQEAGIEESEVQAAYNTEKSSSSGQDSWTVMLYQDADDSILEEDIFTDLNEAESVGSSDKVSIVAQIDRYKKGFSGEQNFSTAKRFYLTADEDLSVINSDELADLGEINMASGDELLSFVTWAVDNYPAAHYVLILSDHGTGWPGGWTDADVKSKSDNILIDGFDDMLYLNEMVSALAQITGQTGIDRLDILGFDACLMGGLEVFTSVQPYARYAIASQETEPSMGWAYKSFLKELTRHPSMNAADLARKIVTSYIAEDTLIVDDEARAGYLERTYDTGGDVSISELIKEESKTVTLAAVDLDQLEGVNSAVNHLVGAMGKINQKMVARARANTRSFESVFGEEYPSPYLDLGNFAKLIKKESTSPNVEAASDALISAMKKAVIAEKHGDSKKGSTGISIYFPNSSLFKEEGSDYATYVGIAGPFAEASLWDDFLTFHYTGQEIKENNAPEKPAEIASPAAGETTLDSIEVSDDTASTGHPVTLFTTAHGENIGYIYLFVGRYTEDGEYIEIVDMDYIDADETYEIDGMILPDWGGSDIEIELDWEPTQYILDDGDYYLPVLLEPEIYGVEMVDTFYSVDGLYSFADGEEDRYARLFFNGDGELIQVMGFCGPDDSGPQHEITPIEGDQITIYGQFIPLTEDEDSTLEYFETGTLTFSDHALVWDSLQADEGEYVIGFIVEDLDGNSYEEYIEITVKQ